MTRMTLRGLTTKTIHQRGKIQKKREKNPVCTFVLVIRSAVRIGQWPCPLWSSGFANCAIRRMNDMRVILVITIVALRETLSLRTMTWGGKTLNKFKSHGGIAFDGGNNSEKSYWNYQKSGQISCRCWPVKVNLFKYQFKESKKEEEKKDLTGREMLTRLITRRQIPMFS